MKVYYLNAVGPTTFSIGGRVYRLTPGESLGPISETEYQQVHQTVDRSRVRFVTADVPDTVQPLPKSAEVDPLYAGVNTESSAVEAKAPLERTYAAEVPESPVDTYGTASVKVEDVSFNPVLKQPELDDNVSSGFQPVAGSNPPLVDSDKSVAEQVEQNPPQPKRRKPKQQ